jgi:hypothetical protein
MNKTSAPQAAEPAIDDDRRARLGELLAAASVALIPLFGLSLLARDARTLPWGVILPGWGRAGAALWRGGLPAQTLPA